MRSYDASLEGKKKEKKAITKFCPIENQKEKKREKSLSLACSPILIEVLLANPHAEVPFLKYKSKHYINNEFLPQLIQYHCKFAIASKHLRGS